MDNTTGHGQNCDVISDDGGACEDCVADFILSGNGLLCVTTLAGFSANCTELNDDGTICTACHSDYINSDGNNGCVLIDTNIPPHFTHNC